MFRAEGRTDVEAAIRDAGGRGTIARGLGRSYGDAAQNGGGQVLDMTSLESPGGDTPDDRGRLRVAAGVSLARVLAAAIPAGWFLPVCPGTRHVTVGGAVASDVHGKNHPAQGSFANHLRDIHLVLADGSDRVIGPGAEPEVFWATTGGMGLTGVIAAATIEMMPISTSAMVVDTDRTADLEATLAALDEAHRRRRYAVAWLDLLRSGHDAGRGVVTAADHAGPEQLPTRWRERLLDYRPGPSLSVRRWPDLRIVNRGTARLLNELTYRRAPDRGRDEVQPISTFFHPLDAVAHWNRAYGRSGLVQYQFAVPEAEVDVIASVVDGLRASGAPGVLGVLKKFGPGTGAPLSFPIEGWTLSVDLPVGVGELAGLLDRFDDQVAEAGGRVYLAKDGRLRPDKMATMYPDLPRWREVRDLLDPEHRLQSDLGRRLGLVEPR